MKILSGFCIVLLKAYQWFISPIFFSLGVQCRFEPSCSNFAIVAVKLHGPWKGGFLVGKRLLRCHPFCEGGHDPVPGTSEYLECSNG